jgi:hypothetical protein
LQRTVVNGVGDVPNQHDVITGSAPDGTLAMNPNGDATCSNYSAATEGGCQHPPLRFGLLVRCS